MGPSSPRYGDSPAARRPVVNECSQNVADQFREYAEEAMLWVAQSKTEKEKRLLIELARTWKQAAIESDRTVIVSTPLEATAAL